MDARRRAAYRRRRRTNRRIAYAALITLALIVVVIAVIYKPDIAKETLTVEAGSDFPAASDFLKKDGAALAYEGAPEEDVDLGTPGQYAVQLRSGRHVYDATIVVEDTVPPTIWGTKDLTLPIGEGISYLADITVTDNASAEPKLEVDTSAVRVSLVGTYPVVYTATDASGNRSTVSVTLTVREKTSEERSAEELYRLADKALSECIDESMTDYERLWAIFCYISKHISYVDNAESKDEVLEGINGFVKRSGSCFTYFASMKAMLERAGFATVDVVRDNKKKEGHHYWSLVKYQGQWYHIDATPRGPEDGKEHLIFLLTDSQIVDMNADYGNYWAYDTKDYPASGTVSPYHGEPLPS